MKKLLRIFVVLVLCYTNLQDSMANATGEGIGKLIPRFKSASTVGSFTPPTTPDAPTNLVVIPINTGGMIQFTAPANDGGSAITNYEYSINNGATWVTPSPAVTTSPLIISSGLTNCTSYQVKIRAVNAAGSGTESAVVTLVPSPSTDFGTNWTSRISTDDLYWTSVTYGNGLFVAVSTEGVGNRVMTSPDGINWTSRTSAADNSWWSVTYGNGLFVAVSSDGVGNQVMTSPDGINWTSRTSAADNEWYGVTYGNGLFVAVAATGTGNRVMTSPDGINWTSRTSTADNAWYAVTYGNGIFVSVSAYGVGNRVMTSGYDIVADAPVISSVTVSQTDATVSFTQSSSAYAPPVTNYRYSIDNGSNWTTFSPVSTSSPITVAGVTEFKNQIQLQAINSVGNSCPAIYFIASLNLNMYGQKSSISSEFVNKNGARGISGIRSTGESRTNIPILSATAAVTDLTSTTATSGGTVGADGGASVTARGVCWSTTTNPTIADSKTVDGSGTGTFTSSITGLTSGTTYYVRSYATNSVGTTYGPEVTFTTL